MKLAVFKFPRLKYSEVIRPALTDGEAAYLRLMYRIERLNKLRRPDLERINKLKLESPEYLGNGVPYCYFQWYNLNTGKLEDVENFTYILYKMEGKEREIPQVTIKKIYGSIKECNKDRWGLHPVAHLWAWDALGFDIE